MKISTLFYTIKQGFANILHNKWYSLASMATIAACLFLFGIFYAILANFENILKTAEEGVSVTVFFNEGTTDARIEELASDKNKIGVVLIEFEQPKEEIKPKKQTKTEYT